jgi:polysaccharide pyruvyl transferase WcaK-like protein
MKNILILADRHALKNRLINIGDKALTDGLYQLIYHHGKANIVTGIWKPFPFLTYSRLAHDIEGKDIHCVFNIWLSQLEAISFLRVLLEYLISFLFTITRIFFSPIEYFFIKKYTRGLFETIEPYFIRGIMYRRLISKIEKADIIIFNGAGLIADHIKKFVPCYLFECYLAIKYNKPIVSVNQSMHINDDILCNAVLYIYSHMNRHFVREPIAKDNLINMGVDGSTIDVVPDTAFLVQINGSVKNSVRDKCHIAITIRGDRKYDFTALITIVKMLQMKGNKITFVHTCYAHDKKILKQLHNRKCSVTEIINDTYEEVIVALSNNAILITDRYHAAIFALKAGVPFVPLKSTTSKLDGLCNLCKADIMPIDMATKDAWKQCVDAVERIQSDYIRIKNSIVKNNVAIEKKAREKYNYLITEMVQLS